MLSIVLMTRKIVSNPSSSTSILVIEGTTIFIISKSRFQKTRSTLPIPLRRSGSFLPDKSRDPRLTLAFKRNMIIANTEAESTYDFNPLDKHPTLRFPSFKKMDVKLLWLKTTFESTVGIIYKYNNFKVWLFFNLYDELQLCHSSQFYFLHTMSLLSVHKLNQTFLNHALFRSFSK